MTSSTTALALDADHRALAAVCEQDAGLCTIVGIDGSFSRGLGAQLAVLGDGSTVGDLADGCLEAQVARDLTSANQPRVVRYGSGSPTIDFRLPCGSGLDLLLDPQPDRVACRAALDRLAERRLAHLPLPAVSPMATREYQPALRIRAFGEGPELATLERLTHAAGIEIEAVSRDAMSLGEGSGLPPADRWTAIVMLFHDHEWEAALIEEALASEAFYIGAQGGERARIARTTELLARGIDESQAARIVSPVGVVPACKTPQTLILSLLAEIATRYEAMRPHG